jgi:hypothetical protein
MQAKQQVISNLKQEAHASGAQMEQTIQQLQEDNRILRRNLEVNSALCSADPDLNLLQATSARRYLRPDPRSIHWYVSQLLTFV